MLRNSNLLSSFRKPDFYLIWMSLFLSSICWSIQNVLVSWLVLETTGSSLLLGVIMTLNFAPQLFGLISGAIADRVDKRKLIIIVNFVQIFFSIIMGILIIGEVIQFWHIALIVLIGSTAGSFRMPVASAYTVELVGKNNITNATSLNNMSMFLAGMVGPSLVGILVNLIGIGTFFYFNAFFLGLALVFAIMIKAETKQTLTQLSVLKDISEGFRFSWQNKAVLGGQLVFLITNIYMWPCNWTLVPIFARNVLSLDAARLGWLTASNRVGGFIANISLASKEPRRKGWMLFSASIIWGLSWLPFSTSTLIHGSMVSQFIIGVTSSLTMTLASIISLVNSKPEMRGRVMGIQTLAIFSQSPGSLVAGGLAQFFGAVAAINVEAILFIITMLCLMKLVPELHKAQ